MPASRSSASWPSSSERHWGSIPRYIPWLALIGLAWSVLRLLRGPSARDVRIARLIALGAMAVAAVGVGFHIIENYKAGPLDQTYSLVWDSMSEPARWLAAFSKSLGPAPTFAPGALALTGVLVLVATQRHPALMNAFSPADGRAPALPDRRDKGTKASASSFTLV